MPVAFFLGAFPTATLFTIARRIGAQKLGLGEAGDNSTPELERLRDIGKANVWIYFQENVPKLYVLSLRGAQEVDSFMRKLASSDIGYRGQTEKPGLRRLHGWASARMNCF